MSGSQFRATLSGTVAILGSVMLVTALAWWWLVFREVVANDYLDIPASIGCAGLSSTVCDLAMSLCRSDHPLDIRWYSPVLLWAGIGLLFGSMLLASREPEAR